MRQWFLGLKENIMKIQFGKLTDAERGLLYKAAAIINYHI